MGKLSNGADGVTINEVTVSHRATKNSPHDALTWEPHGIRGVSMDGIHVHSNATTIVRSVNISVGGVSFECDTSMLDVLSDKEARDSLVVRSLVAQAEKDAREKSLHEWVEDAAKASTFEGQAMVAYQCKRCTSWVVGSKEMEKPAGGCLGRAPTDKEKRQQNAQAAIQDLGRRLQAIHETARCGLQNGLDVEDVIALTPKVEELFKAFHALEPVGLAENTNPETYDA